MMGPIRRRALTREIEARVVKEQFFRVGEQLTVAELTLDNGFVIRGNSSCHNSGQYDEDRGQIIARDRALARLLPLFEFLECETKFQDQVKDATDGQ